jgi:dihydrofolate reductase
MIYVIVAIDKNRGMANDHGIPWQGKTPTDVKRFREKTTHSNVLMGYTTYTEFKVPLSDRKNYVASSKQENLREGFELVNDARKFLQDTQEDVWVIGGPGLIAATIDLVDELHITQLKAEFACTKFLPEYQDKFTLKEESEPITENNITYTFQTWVRK